jgi:hypothetical protein
MELFAARVGGDMEKFRQSFESSKEQASSSLLQPDVCLAAQREHHQILRFCLDQGAVFDRYLNRAAQMGARSVEMLELLLAANWSTSSNLHGKWIDKSLILVKIVSRGNG